jgi:hypothetical protein
MVLPILAINSAYEQGACEWCACQYWLSFVLISKVWLSKLAVNSAYQCWLSIVQINDMLAKGVSVQD